MKIILVSVVLSFAFLQSSLAAGGSVVVISPGGGDVTNVPPGLTNVIAVSTGLSDALALLDDGNVAAWGANDLGVTNVPSNVTNVVAISSGWLYHMALRGDGIVITWGSSTAQAPGDLSNVVAIAAGGHQFCLGLLSNRTVAGWGSNGAGQTNVPPNVTNAIAVAAGLDHCLALRGDGTVVAWGDNSFGACDVPANLTNVVAISAGWSQSLALRANGTVVGWGSNTVNLPANLTNVVVMAAGWDASQDFILHDGTMAKYSLSNAIAAARGNFYSVVVTASNRPPANTALLTRLTWTNGRFDGFISSRYGRVYALEYRDHLTDPNWSYLPLMPGNGSSLQLEDPAANVSQRFYRATRW
jgi:hypothetical protein